LRVSSAGRPLDAIGATVRRSHFISRH
jgi:hypothetical protein